MTHDKYPKSRKNPAPTRRVGHKTFAKGGAVQEEQIRCLNCRIWVAAGEYRCPNCARNPTTGRDEDVL